MSTSKVTPIRSQNPLETARLALVKKLLALSVPSVLTDFGAVNAHMLEAAAIVDEWVASLGNVLADNTTASVDLRSFKEPLTYALDGNATYAFEQAIENEIEEHADMLRSA
jgi:hypothetical protein